MKVRRTKVPNLVIAEDSGNYYARIRVHGKLKWRSLRTKTFTTAKLRLKDVEMEMRRGAVPVSGTLDAKITFEDAFKHYRAAVENNASFKPATKHFRLRSERTLRRTWPGLWKKELRRVKAEECKRWLNDFRNGGAAFTPNLAKTTRRGDSPTTINAAIRFLRAVFNVGVEGGIIYSNPADELKSVTPKKKLLQLPNRQQFAQLVAEVRGAHSRWGQGPGEMVEGLAYTGARVGEARRMIWAHIDEERGLVTIPGEKTESAPRTNPMTPAFRDLIQRMKARREHRQVDPLFEVQSVLGSLRASCQRLGIPKIDHHDLRHLFATTCIESGVDVLVVSNWLGHSDGGALVLRTYGHLRPEHSTRAAKMVDFAPPAG